MTQTYPLPRRTFLKGLGTTMALPLLEAMQPQSVLAGDAPLKAPKRMAFIFFPNGAIMPDWAPRGEGTNYQLGPTLAPLEPLKDDVLLISGLTHDKARPNGDGPGDHARCAATYLTGAQAKKTGGADLHVGVSVDQVAASKLGHLTRLPSLELGTERGRNAGQCDSGYSCAYSSNISWKTPSTPMAKEVVPQLVFDRLFGAERDAAKGRALRELYRKSILDLVADDAQRLRDRLGKTDREKIEEYFTSVRELEQRIERAARDDRREVPEMDLPEGVPADYAEHVQLMYELMHLAFQTDTTRIITFMVGNAGSNRSYGMVGVREGWHQLSHHRNDRDKIEKLKRIDRFHVEQFAAFLKRLKATPEGKGTLLDNCMIVYGSAIADGNRHTHHDLPVVLAGRGGGTIPTGRHIRAERETPMANLFLSMLDRLGIHERQFGDSTGRFHPIDAKA